MKNNNPIGIFDSGVGGLSVFSKLIKLLPEENYIYFGDTINMPYGNKTKEQLISIAIDIFDFFKEQNVKAVVMACNTTSATVYDVLKDNYNFKIYPIVQTFAKSFIGKNYKTIGVFATGATINNHAYKREINACNSNINVVEIACPNWAYIVENSLQYEQKNIDDIKEKLDKILKYNPDKIILGCTHYPYLMEILEKYANRNLFIDPSEYFAQYIREDIIQSRMENNKKDYEPMFLVSNNSEQFIKSAKLFYDVKTVKEISITKCTR